MSRPGSKQSLNNRAIYSIGLADITLGRLSERLTDLGYDELVARIEMLRLELAKLGTEISNNKNADGGTDGTG